MGFNKVKAVRAAEKYLSQGKIANAIQEYSRIVAADVQDFAALNMLGDLYSRTGKATEAINCFKGVAEHYRAQGFALKAIAIYKKILRLNPALLEAVETLAELYSGQGLIVEARTQFLQIADAYTHQGNTRAALDVLRRIADLDPSNGEVRLRVAESYARENFAPEAVESFTEAGERFLDRNQPEQALAAFDRALSFAPHDLRVLQGFVLAHTALDSADEAAEMLERCVTDAANANSENENAFSQENELRHLLLRSYLAAENPIAAERTLHALIAAHPSENEELANLKIFLDIARLYMSLGDTDAGVRALSHALEPLLTEREDNALLEVLNEALARNPEHIEALKYLARIYTWQHDEAKLRQTLERLIEAAEEAGDEDQERRAIEQLISFTTPEPRYTERLNALGGSLLPLAANLVGSGHGNHSSAFYARENNGAAAAAASSSDESNKAQEVPTFESFMLEENRLEENRFNENRHNESKGFEFAGSSSSSEFDLTVQPAAVDNLETAHSFGELNFNSSIEATKHQSDASSDNYNNAAFNEHQKSDSSVAMFDSTFDATSSFADLNDDFADNNHAPTTTTITTTTTNDVSSFSVESDAQAERVAALLKSELEGVDFYLSQGYLEVARETLEMLERQYGAHAELALRRQTLESQTLENQAPEDASDAAAQPQNAAGNSKIDAGSQDFDLSFDIAPPTSSIIESNHAAPSFGTQDFALQDFALPDFALDNATAESVLGTNGSSAIQNASPSDEFAALFEEFKTAVEDDQPKFSGDYETHYNLGIAYQEMDLLDEAIEEYQKAANMVAPGDGTPHFFQCCNMLGHCFMSKQLYQLAVMWFRKGINAPGHTEDEYQALRYELGTAYERMGDTSAATDVLMQVYGHDVSYRGVAERLRSLRDKSILMT